MRVLLAHKLHHITGGAEVFYFEVGKILSENGHDVAYFSTEDDRNVVSENFYGVSSPKYNSSNLIAKVSAVKDIFYSGAKKQAMLDAIDDFRPDVIHVFAIHTHLTPSILEAAKERLVPVLMSCNDYKHICPNYKLYDGESVCESCKGGRYYNAILKKCCHNSLAYSVASAVESYVHENKGVYDALVAKYLFASDFMLNKTKEFWAEKDLYYGVLRNPFDSARIDVVEGGDYVLYFGRIIDEKGVELLTAEASKTNIPLKVVGDGPDLTRLKRYVADAGASNIEFLGALWGDELIKVLNNAAFVVVPSLWHENFPYVIFQAFAAGKSVLGSNRGGIPELIRDGRGLVFDVEREGDLGRKMLDLWEDKASTIRMGKIARQYLDAEFGNKLFYETLIGHYRSVM